MILVLFACALLGLVLIGAGRSAVTASARTNQAVTADAAGGWLASGRLSGVLAMGALLWIIGAVLALFFVPMVVEESVSTSSGSSVVTATQERHPLIQASGPARAAAVAVGAAVVFVALWLGRPQRSALFVMGYLAIVFCVITGFSIGLFFLPVPVLLLAAGATSPTRSPQGRAWSERER